MINRNSECMSSRKRPKRLNPESGLTQLAGASRPTGVQPTPPGSPALVPCAADTGAAGWRRRPLVRAEKVAHVRARFADSSYPSPQILAKVAAVLARKF